MMRMPGFGLDGPWRDKPAFAYVIEAAAGITWLTGYPDRNPDEPYSVGDPNAGIHAFNALLLALAHRRRTGEGSLIEAAMVDAAINVAAEQVIEHSAYGELLERDGQPRTHRGAAEPVPHQRNRRVRSARLLGGDRRGHRRAVADPTRCARQPRTGRWTRRCRPPPGAANTTTSSTSTWPTGVHSAPATRSSKGCGMQACPSAR